MSIVRGPRKERDFTILSNSLIRDARMSMRARGVLVYLLSLPPNASTNAEAITAQAKEGREAIRTALGEIEAAGYMTRGRRQGEGGRFQSWQIVHEEPVSGQPAGAAAEVSEVPAVDADMPGTGDSPPPGISAGQTEDGFPGVGSPDAGSPDVGSLGAKREEPSRRTTPSLRSGAPAVAQPALDPTLEAPPKPVDLKAIAREVADDWLEHSKPKDGTRIPNGDRIFNALVKAFITPALEAGVTVDDVKRALVACDEWMPSKAKWERALRGRNLSVIQGGRRGNVHTEVRSPEEDRARARAMGQGGDDW